MRQTVDGEEACEPAPQPRAAYQEEDEPTRQRRAERPPDRHALVHADVHQRVDRRDEQERHGEPVSVTHGVRQVEVPQHDRRHGHGHVDGGRQQVHHRQVAQEEVRARAHRGMTYDDDDHQRVADESQQHEGCESDR